MDDEYEDTQWTDAARQRLRSSSDSLRLAIGNHVEALSGLAGKRDDIPTVFEANDALIAALRSYNEAIFDLTGTSAVPLYDDDDDDGEEEPLAPADTLRLSVEARFDFIVRDESRFTSYVRDRYVSPEMDEEEVELHVGDPTGCLSELFQMDCWDASAYAAFGLEPAGEGWRVGYIPKALFEMTFDERDDRPPAVGPVLLRARSASWPVLASWSCAGDWSSCSGGSHSHSAPSQPSSASALRIILP